MTTPASATSITTTSSSTAAPNEADDNRSLITFAVLVLATEWLLFGAFRYWWSKPCGCRFRRATLETVEEPDGEPPEVPEGVREMDAAEAYVQADVPPAVPPYEAQHVDDFAAVVPEAPIFLKLNIA